MCFLNLYNCSAKLKDLLNNNFLGQDYSDNITLYDLRTRNRNYISPEHIKIGDELAEIVKLKNGKIDENTFEMQEFLLMK